MDAFEIQVYDGTANAQHAIGVELHTNAVIRGLTTSNAPELPLNHTAHFTLEPSYGLFSWWELGGYLQTAITSDGTFDYAGVKLRSKFVTPPGFHPHLRFGLNVELAVLPKEFDRDEWGMELRPIAAWENEQFMFVINPIVGISLAGVGSGEGPGFEPAATALYKFGERVSIGLEYYGSLGPFSHVLDVKQQEHYVFEVVNVLAIKNVEINLGFGQGLTPASGSFVAKMILGYTWDRFVTKARIVR